MKEWIEPQEVHVPEGLETAVGGHPLVAKTLARRGILDPGTARAFLDPDQYAPTPAMELPGMDRAVSRLQEAVEKKERICVWGDFDVDGQTSTTLLVSTLKTLGAEAGYHIPVRGSETHGVGLHPLKEILDRGIDLLLTCDTGITSHEAIDYAQASGVDVILTDHHDLPPSLPGAYAIVNSKMLPAGHPLSTLPGAGVAYKLAEELLHRRGRAEECQNLLDLAALGIVADVAELIGDARYLTQLGLRVLRSSRRPGLQALYEAAELDPEQITEEHIGFLIGPRLNALGRLSDANPIVEFFTTQNPNRARALALQLETLNARRKLLTNQVFQGALAQIEQDPSLLDEAALVLANPTWPAGVIGIVASRLVERFNKPAVLIASPPGEIARGSARSIPGIHITEAIAAQQEMLAGFGGHPMAAGLGIDAERIAEFRRALSRTIYAQFPTPPKAALPIDEYLPISELTLDLALDLERLAPFGNGNPSLVLACKDLRVVSCTLLGRDEEHLQVILEDGAGFSRRVIWWQGGSLLSSRPFPEGRIDLAYSVRSSTFNGVRDVQVEWVDFRPAEASAVEVAPEPPAVEIVDLRSEQYPLPVLQKILAGEEVQVWCEAEAKKLLAGEDRNTLSPSPSLAIWTIPPGRSELRAALDTVQPQKIYLLGVDPAMDDLEVFLKRLAGLIKHVLARHETAAVSELAAATAQKGITVRRGLAWLESKGILHIVEEEGDRIILAAGPAPGRQQGGQAEITAQLKALLEETAAFRAYFRRMPAGALITEQDIHHKGY